MRLCSSVVNGLMGYTWLRPNPKKPPSGKNALSASIAMRELLRASVCSVEACGGYEAFLSMKILYVRVTRYPDVTSETSCSTSLKNATKHDLPSETALAVSTLLSWPRWRKISEPPSCLVGNTTTSDPTIASLRGVSMWALKKEPGPAQINL